MVYRLALVPVLFTLLGAVEACYEQCGGIGWTGATTCTGGCVCTYQNPYYSQCLVGASTTSSTSSVKTTTSTTSTSTKVTTSTTTSTKTTTSTSASASATAASGTKYWFSFGDSYTQTGFNYSTGPLPSTANPFGNPAFPGYTACGSYTNWIDELTVKYNESLIYQYNYAYGGATINATLVAPYEPTVLSLVDQVNEFLTGAALKPSTSPWTSANSIASIWIGINDVGNSYWNSNDSAFNTGLIDNYFALVQKLYNVGVRNFLFVNVPPVDNSPFVISYGTTVQAEEHAAIADYNSQLASRISAFKAANSGTKTWLFDSNTLISKLLASPTTYGFADNTTYSSATNVMWCNNLHISPG
ncbi:hypothetical protein FRB95_013258 [Tulasnella sp. JGI-2019a]|nr:hypothetical protein FRB95_013258 [Tulasnella sp. JGI-2019a]